MKHWQRLAAPIGLGLCTLGAAAQDAPRPTNQTTPAADPALPTKEPETKHDAEKKIDDPKPLVFTKADPKKPAITTHSMPLDASVGGGTIDYTASTGLVELADYDGKTKANVYFIAYTKNNAGDLAQRPITFAYNGGPGSSSVWLHLGALGPKRVRMGPEGEVPKPPYELIDNPYTWLAFTDLVFIDPVSTGYSRPVENEGKEQFHGLDEDAQWMSDFIRLYTTREKRWSSPKFLTGESYGTTRSAAVVDRLQDTHGLYINGIVLVSMVLNFQTLDAEPGNDLPYWLFVPAYTATAWHHKALSPEMQARTFEDAVNQAEDWSIREYGPALARGEALSDPERRAIAAGLAKYTGLSEAYCERADLRISQPRFCKELLRSRLRTVGRLDSRYLGIDADANQASAGEDPSYSAIQGVYTACLNRYLREELKYENDAPYEILTGRVHPWNYRQFTNSFVNVAPRLRDAFHKNRDLHVMVAAGYFDLATPYFASDYTLDHMGLDPSLRGQIVRHYYKAGHMMYVREADLVQLAKDTAAFYAMALQRP
jgi:carboxypeptidase C (cathepsin A)